MGAEAFLFGLSISLKVVVLISTTSQAFVTTVSIIVVFSNTDVDRSLGLI